MTQNLDRPNPIPTPAPWLLLITDSSPSSAGLSYEHALRKTCNLVTVRVSELNLVYHLSRLGSKASTEILHRYLRFHGINPRIFDLAVVIDPVYVPFRFQRFGIPSAYIAMDTHTQIRRHSELAEVENYDFVFVGGGKHHIKKYRDIGCKNVSWLPMAADPAIHRPLDAPEVFDLTFIGGTTGGRSYRRELLAQLSELLKTYRIYIGKQYLHDLAFYFSSSKTLFNHNQLGYVSERIFIALACRRLLLTDDYLTDVNGLLDLYADRRHLVIYHDIQEAAELAKYYIEEEKERTAIAERGYSETVQNHTYGNRALTLLKTTHTISHRYQHEMSTLTF